MSKLYLPRVFSKIEHEKRLGTSYTGWTDMVDGEQIYVVEEEYAHPLSKEEIEGDYYLGPEGEHYELTHYVDSPNGKYTFSSCSSWEVEDESLK